MLSNYNAHAADSPVHEKKLANGFRVFVKVDNRSPVVSSHVWYRVGSVDEYSGSTGLSHILEHMMFRGTRKHPKDAFSKIVNQFGGEHNAFTSRDYTGYYQTIGSEHLEKMLELEADRMRNVIFEQKGFEKERDVVAEERRYRVEDKPLNRLNELFYATAYVTSPYHHPIIGWMKDIEETQIDDLYQWYNRFYTPNNALLVVVGKVKPKEVFAMAEATFGKIKPNVMKPLKTRPEIPQKGERRVVMEADADLHYVLMGYHVPSLKTATQDQLEDVYALDVLSGILSGSSSARLPKVLVRRDKVTSKASSYYNMTSLKSTLFILDGIAAHQGSTLSVEQALNEEIDRLKTELVKVEELERIKTNIKASEMFQKDSIFYQAYEIALLETIGVGWNLTDEYLKNISMVTQEDLQRVARKYLVKNNRTTAVLNPTEEH